MTAKCVPFQTKSKLIPITYKCIAQSETFDWKTCFFDKFIIYTWLFPFFIESATAEVLVSLLLRWLDQSLLRGSTGEENSNFFSLVSGSQWVMGTSGDFLTCALEMVEVWLNMTWRGNRCCFFKPLHPYISMYILRTVLYIFSKVLTGRV